MTGQHLDQDAIAADAVRQVAALMAAAAITAPKSGGQLFLAGKPTLLETVIIDDPATCVELAGWLHARGKERREAIWFRDADVAQAVDAILLVGLAPTCPRPAPCPSGSREPHGPAAPATDNNPATPPRPVDLQHAAHRVRPSRLDQAVSAARLQLPGAPGIPARRTTRSTEPYPYGRL